MKAIVLAGGFGTRLQSVVSDRPKPMALINGKPFLTYLFAWLQQGPVEEIVLSVGYMADSIIDYFGTNYQGIKITYNIEDKPLGTGGAILSSLKYIQDNLFMVINGDTFFPINIPRFLEQNSITPSDIAMALKELPDISRYGSVKIDSDQNILSFEEKKGLHSTGNINGGVYLLNKKVFESGSLPSSFSFEKQILEKKQFKMKGFIFDDPFIDIGIPEDYLKAQTIL